MPPKVNTYHQRLAQSNPSLSNIIVVGGLNLLIFLLPWIFSIETEEYYEIAKGFFLIIVVAILLMIWGINVIIKKRFSSIKTFLDLPILISVIILLISTILSISPDTSFWGYHMKLTGGFLITIILVGLYYLIVNNIDNVDVLKQLLRNAAYSIWFVAIFSILKAFGVLDSLINSITTGNPDFKFIESPLFSPVGSTNALPQLFLLAFPISIFLLLNKKTNSLLSSIKGLIITITLVIAIFVSTNSIDNNSSDIMLWLILIFTTILSVLFIKKAKHFETKNKLPYNLIILLFLVITLIFSFDNNTKNQILSGILGNKKQINIEFYPRIPFETSKEIIEGTLEKYKLKSIIIGTGQDTYGYLFPQFRPMSQNQQSNWTANYSVANTQIEMLLTGSGILGAIIIFGAFCLKIFQFVSSSIYKDEVSKQKKSLIVLSITLAIFVISFFIFIHSLLFLFYSWLFIAIGTKLYYLGNPDKTYKFEARVKIVDQYNTDKEVNIISFIFGIILIIFAVVIIVTTTINIYAEKHFSDGIKASINNQYNLAYDKILAASILNPNRDYYQSSKATIALTKLDELFANQLIDEQLTETERQEKELAANYLLNLITTSLDAAVKTNPENYENWQQSAVIFKRLTEISQGTRFGNETLVSISNALELNKNNPDNYLILAFIYQFNADEAKRSEAEQVYLKAYDLQPSYRQTIIQFGDYLEARNKKEDAQNLYQISLEKFYSQSSTFNSYLIQKLELLKAK